MNNSLASDDAKNEVETEVKADIGTFLAMSIHDMKNSVSVLIGGLEQMLQDVSPQSFSTYAEVAHLVYESKRINNNMIQLLTLYKVNQNIYPFDPLPQSISDFATILFLQQETLLKSKNIALELDVDQALYWQFDEVLVSSVISQAINNAFHYTRDKIRLVIRKADEMLELRVEDNGSGFPERMLQESIDAIRGIDFQGGGTGLGLYFSAIVARMHQRRGKTGEVFLENGGAYNGGCFVMHLP